MKVKFSWGTGLLVFILLFITGVIGFFIFSSRQVYHLVEEDYYEKEIRYQEQIDKMKNVRALSRQVSFLQGTDTLLIVFPDSIAPESISGLLHIYRPSDSRLDRFIRLAPDNAGRHPIDIRSLATGRFILKIDWVMDGKSYYQEESIIIR